MNKKTDLNYFTSDLFTQNCVPVIQDSYENHFCLYLYHHYKQGLKPVNIQEFRK